MFRLSLALLALLSCACGSSEFFSVPSLEDGDLLVLAEVDDSGAVTRAEARVFDGVLEFERAFGHALVGWRVPSGDLIGADGRPLSSSMMDEVTAVLDDGDIGGCGGCVDGQVIFPGDRCHPSASNDAFGDVDALDGRLELVRKSVVIAWPGECACAPPGPERTLELETVVPEVDGAPAEVISVAPDGLVGVAGWSFAAVISPDGSRQDVAWDDASRPFESSIRTMAGYPDGFLISSVAPTMEQLEVVDVFDRQMQHRFRLPDSFTEVEKIRYDEATGGVAIFAQSRAGEAYQPPVLHFCDPDSDGFACASLLAPQLTRADSFIDFARLDGEAAVMPDSRNGLYFFSRLPAPRVIDRLGITSNTNGELVVKDGAPAPWSALIMPTLELPFGTADFRSSEAIASIGNRYFLGAIVKDESTERLYSVLLTGTASAADFREGAPPPTPILCRAHTGAILDFLPVPGEPDQLQLVVEGSKSVVVDGTGAVLSGAPSTPCGGEPSSNRIANVPSVAALDRSGDWHVLLSNARRVYRALNDETTYSPVFGPPGQAHRGHLVSSADRVWSLVPPRTVEELRLAPDARSLSVLPTEVPGLEAGASTRFLASTAGALPGTAVVAVKSGDVTTIRRVELEEGSVDILLERESFPYVTALVEPVEGAVIALTGDALYEIRDGDATVIEIDWDDPDTGTVESKPACAPIWRALATRGGVAYAVGCAGAAVRILAQHRPTRVQAVSLGRPEQTTYRPEIGDEPPQLDAPGLGCAHRAWIHGGYDSLGRPRIWQIDADQASTALTVRDFDRLDVWEEPRDFGVSRVRWVVEREGQLSSVHVGRRGSVDYFPAAARATYGAGFTALAAASDGSLILGASGGRLVVGRFR